MTTSSFLTVLLLSCYRTLDYHFRIRGKKKNANRVHCTFSRRDILPLQGQGMDSSSIVAFLRTTSSTAQGFITLFFSPSTTTKFGTEIASDLIFYSFLVLLCVSSLLSRYLLYRYFGLIRKKAALLMLECVWARICNSRACHASHVFVLAVPQEISCCRNNNHGDNHSSAPHIDRDSISNLISTDRLS